MGHPECSAEKEHHPHLLCVVLVWKWRITISWMNTIDLFLDLMNANGEDYQST